MRQDFRPDLVDGIHDLFERHQESGDGDRPLGINDAAFGRNYFEHAIKAAVERQVRKEGLHAGCDGGEGRPER